MSDAGDAPDQTPADPLGGLGDLLGSLGGGGGGLGDLFAQAQNAMAASAQAAEAEVEGSAGGGVVRIVGTGGGEIRSVTISPAVVDREDIETLQDLIVAALRDLNSQISALHEQAMGGLGDGDMFGGMLGGLGGVIDVDDDEE